MDLRLGANQNIAKTRDVIRADRRLSVLAVTELVNLNRKAIGRILTDELHKRKICVKVVPKVLPDDQKQCRKDVFVHMLEHTENEPNLLESVVTSDETWIFTYDTETVSNTENALAFDGPLRYVRCCCCPRLHPFHCRQGRILLARKSLSRHHLVFAIHSLLHRMPSRFLHLLHPILEILRSIGQSR
ncbi:uncharacterized protein TNCV_4785971 [Trichonephila clavipes]|nr:uncharacterized protein TNCV_4785971 [Trichonephila clavipes]